MLKKIIGSLILKYNIGGVKTRLSRANLKISSLQNKLSQEAELNATLTDMIRNIKFDLEILDSESLALIEEYKKLQEDTISKSSKLKESYDRKTRYYTEFRNLKCSSKHLLKQSLLVLSLDDIKSFYELVNSIDDSYEMMLRATVYIVEKFIGGMDMERFIKVDTSNENKVKSLNRAIKDFLYQKGNGSNVINFSNMSYKELDYYRMVQSILYMYEKSPLYIIDSLIRFQSSGKNGYFENSL